jgi:NADP-dependent 3-hydroxy acid dehydrogenase YdfG
MTSAGTDGPARVVVVAGATGYVGTRLADGLAARGWDVVACARASQRFDVWLRRRPGVRRVTFDELEQGPGAVARAVAGYDVRGAVAAIGGWDVGPALLATSTDAFRAVLDSHLTPHLVAARAIVPALDAAGGGAHVVLNGVAAQQAIAGAGGVCVTGAGLAMMTRVLREEADYPSVHVRDLSLMAALAGDDRNLDPVAELAPATVVAAVEDVLLAAEGDVWAVGGEHGSTARLLG